MCWRAWAERIPLPLPMTVLLGDRAILGLCAVELRLVSILFIDGFQLTLILLESFQSLHYPELLNVQPLENVSFIIVFCGQNAIFI